MSQLLGHAKLAALLSTAALLTPCGLGLLLLLAVGWCVGLRRKQYRLRVHWHVRCSVRAWAQQVSVCATHCSCPCTCRRGTDPAAYALPRCATRQQLDAAQRQAKRGARAKVEDQIEGWASLCLAQSCVARWLCLFVPSRGVHHPAPHAAVADWYHCRLGYMAGSKCGGVRDLRSVCLTAWVTSLCRRDDISGRWTSLTLSKCGLMHLPLNGQKTGKRRQFDQALLLSSPGRTVSNTTNRGVRACGLCSLDNEALYMQRIQLTGRFLHEHEVFIGA